MGQNTDIDYYCVMEFPPKRAEQLVNRISEILKNRQETIAVTEAACGGLLSSYLVSVPGASEWFDGGTLVYSLKSRLKLSGWDSKDIENYTGPSTNVALRLARNLRLELGSTYTLSETGYASAVQGNPEAASKTGVVYYGISGPQKDICRSYSTGSDDRCSNMQQFALKGLEFLLQELERYERSPEEHTNKKARSEEIEKCD